jgi:hypothetical protein
LVQAGVDQINHVPGSTKRLDRNNLSGCHNPTISPDGGNRVAQEHRNPPFPKISELLKGARVAACRHRDSPVDGRQFALGAAVLVVAGAAGLSGSTLAAGTR